ncbi:MAG TPA: nucleotidyltransferase domain-containing protein [Arthrobacter sp.]|nr:nucleotidyltransferase domain-containing protein [Arthrobacter sp.]
MNDADFLAYVGDRLMDLPVVQAVALGGSRAQGTHDPDSDWDLAIYYRGRFEPDSLRALGWSGEVSEIGDWGGGVFTPLMFHLAGIPSYLVVGELAINQVLRGQLPRPKYPEALRNEAPAVWWNIASMLDVRKICSDAASGASSRAVTLRESG